MNNLYEIRGDVTAIMLASPDGFREALIDTADLELVASMSGLWGLTPQARSNTRYARITIRNQAGNRSKMLMHRLLLSAPCGVQVDHRDGNGLNNSRSNLRIANHAENAWNRVYLKRNASGYRGVCRHKQRSKWQAEIKTEQRHVYLGVFHSAEEAARAYDAAARKFGGAFAILNFPDEAVGR